MKYFPFFLTLLVVSLASTTLLICVLIDKDVIEGMANTTIVATETDVKDKFVAAATKGENSETLARNEKRAKEKRVKVIIMSQPRSGSSFTGDIFNHHPDVFYLYEPLHNFKKSHAQATEESYDKMAMTLLRDIFTCNITDHGLFNELVARQQLMQWQTALLLPLVERKRTTWNYKFSPSLFPVNIQKACKDYRITVAKILTGRLPAVGMESLVSLCNTDEFECFIIHLVRDPRAVMRSLSNLSLFGAETVTASLLEQEARKKCEQIEENINFMQQLPEVFKNRPVRLHYEDLVENPEEVVRDLFDFVGLHLVDSVEEWLNKSTNPAKDLAIKNKANPYSTVKNSKKVMNEWRVDTSLMFIEIVERVCWSLMDTLGYLKTDGANEKLRDLRIPLFLRKTEKLVRIRG